MYSIATVCKIAASTGIFILSVYTKNGTIFGMFDTHVPFQRGETGDFTESGWMDVLVCVHCISGLTTFYFSRLGIRVKLQLICFSLPLLLTIPIATIVQLVLERDEVGMWFPTVPDHDTTILLIISLCCGFISMAIVTEHIWRDKSTTYALDR